MNEEMKETNENNNENGSHLPWICSVCRKELPTERGKKIHETRVHKGQ